MSKSLIIILDLFAVAYLILFAITIHLLVRLILLILRYPALKLNYLVTILVKKHPPYLFLLLLVQALFLLNFLYFFQSILFVRFFQNLHFQSMLFVGLFNCFQSNLFYLFLSSFGHFRHKKIFFPGWSI